MNPNESLQATILLNFMVVSLLHKLVKCVVARKLESLYGHIILFTFFLSIH